MTSNSGKAMSVSQVLLISRNRDKREKSVGSVIWAQVLNADCGFHFNYPGTDRGS